MERRIDKNKKSANKSPNIQKNYRNTNTNSSTKTKKNLMIRKKKKRTRYADIVGIILFVLFISYIVFYIASSINKPQVTATKVIAGSVETPTVYNGIIVRDETVYKSQNAGVVVFNVENTAMVKKGDLVCYIQDQDTYNKLQQSLQKAKSDIISMQEKRTDLSASKNEIDKANKTIKQLIDDNSYKASEIQFSNLYDFKSQLGAELDIRNKLLLNDDMGSVQDLVKSKNQLQQQLDSSREQIYADIGGIVSYNIDSYENVFTMANIAQLTQDQLKINNQNQETTVLNQSVSPGTNVFKVVNSNDWYIASYMPALDAVKMNVGDEKTIYAKLNDVFTPVDVTVFQNDNRGTQAYVVFKATKYMIDYLDVRSLQFKMDSNISQGLKIPNTAIAQQTLLEVPKSFVYEKTLKNDSNPELYCLKSDGTTNSEVKLVTMNYGKASDTVYYVVNNISTLKTGDTVVDKSDPSKTYQIENVVNVKGVYITNSDIPTFEIIDPKSILSQNLDYTIINPSLNSNIKVEDNIISDTTKVSPQDVAY